MRKSLQIFRLFGIGIELHYSWFIIFLLLAWGLSVDFFPHYYPGLTEAIYWTIGSIASVLLFASVLAHEISHSLIARKQNIAVEKITLFFFGGIAHIKGEERLTPRKEFTMAIAGPISSLILGILFFVISKNIGFIYVKATSHYLYIINFFLAFFNMVPGFPLDGGRVFRAILWKYYKDIKKATSIASYGGKVFAVVLIFLGFITSFGIIDIRIFDISIGGLWFIIIGFFLFFIAGASYEQLLIKDVLANVKVKDIMSKEFRMVSPDVTLAHLFQDYFLKYGIEGMMVGKNDIFLGFVSVDLLKQVPKDKWPKTKVRAVFIPASKIPSAKETDSALAQLRRMSLSGIPIVPILKGKKIMGVVSNFSLMRYIKLKEEV